MLGFLGDLIFETLPLRVQWGCLAVFLLVMGVFVIWLNWPEA